MNKNKTYKCLYCGEPLVEWHGGSPPENLKNRILFCDLKCLDRYVRHRVRQRLAEVSIESCIGDLLSLFAEEARLYPREPVLNLFDSAELERRLHDELTLKEL